MAVRIPNADAFHIIKHGAERIAIVDFDVHHGNGTQDIFWSDKDLFYGSTHEMPLFPGTGAVAERGVGNIGGGMDLAAGARKVIVAMEHTTRDGKPKIVKQTSIPLTAPGCVDMIITDLAVIVVTGEGLELREIAPGWTPAEVQQLTEPVLKISSGLKEIEL